MPQNRVLIAEDDFAHAIQYKDALERRGFEVNSAINGSEAINFLSARMKYDVVISDLMIPPCDMFSAKRTDNGFITGAHISKEIRRRRKNTPIIIITSTFADANFKKAMSLVEKMDNTFVVRKSEFTPTELALTVENLVYGGPTGLEDGLISKLFRVVDFDVSFGIPGATVSVRRK